MALQITYFVHGTSQDNEDGISSGWKDVELSKLGVEQAKELGELTKDMQFDAVICSDLQRAHDTAKLAFGDRYEIQPDTRLRECDYGDYNGEPSEIVEPMQEKAITEPMPNGESYEDVKVRMKELLDELKRDYDGMRVALVAHKAPQLALEVLLNGASWEEAFANDWRNTKAWQPGWKFELK